MRDVWFAALFGWDTFALWHRGEHGPALSCAGTALALLWLLWRRRDE